MTGFRSKMMLALQGKGMGKSGWDNMIRDLTMPDVEVLDSAQVDGQTWYTVQLSMPAREWLREQPLDEWREHINLSQFDVSEKMYTALQLKWS